MMKRRLLYSVLAVLVGCRAWSPDPVPVTPTRQYALSAVPYPADYALSFEHYLTVTRPDSVIRQMYINPAGIAALRQNRPLPDDTVIVIAAYVAMPDGEGGYRPGEQLPQLHVAQKNSAWQPADLPGPIRAGDWNYASFSTWDGQRLDEDLNACIHCHEVRPQHDYLHSLSALLAYVDSGTVQYLACDFPRRIPCD